MELTDTPLLADELGHNQPFPPLLCNEVGIEVDIDSSIIIRETFAGCARLFLHKQRSDGLIIPGATMHVKTDIRENHGSFGLNLNLRNEIIKKSVNIDLKLAMSYEIGEIHCNNITHKLHLVILDDGLSSRTKRDLRMERKGAVVVANQLQSAKMNCQKRDDIPVNVKQSLNQLNAIKSNARLTAADHGIHSKSVKSQPSPKWNLTMEIMTLVAEEFDKLTSLHVDELPPNHTLETKIKHSLKKSSFFFASQAGSKLTLKYPHILRLTPDESSKIQEAWEKAQSDFDSPNEIMHRNGRRGLIFQARKMEDAFSRLVKQSTGLSTWIRSISMYLFPGIEEKGPYFLDIGYQIMFPDKPYLFLLADAKKCRQVLNQMLRTHGVRSRESDDESEDEYKNEEDGEVALEIATALEFDGLQDSCDITFEEDVSDTDGDVRDNIRFGNSMHGSMTELVFLSTQEEDMMNLIGPDGDSIPMEDMQDDVNLNTNDYVTETRVELHELYQEGLRFVGSDKDLYNEMLSAMLSAPDTGFEIHKEERDNLGRSSCKEARYLFGSRFGNIYTGYPRIAFRDNEFVENVTHWKSKSKIGCLQYPDEGPASCVMYASGLKNMNVYLNDNISEHAMEGFGALTRLLLEKDDLLEGEFATSMKRWEEMLNVAKKQQENELQCLERSKEEYPFCQSLRLEFRTFFLWKTGNGDTDDNNALSESSESSSFGKMDLPWPKCIFSGCCLEHTQHYHETRTKLFSELMVPLDILKDRFIHEDRKESVWQLGQGYKNYLTFSSCIVENFVNVFASPRSQWYSLFQSADDILPFYSLENRILATRNFLQIPFQIDDDLVLRYYRTDESCELIDVSKRASLSRRVRAIRGRRTNEERERAMAMRLTPAEKFHVTILRKDYMKRTKCLDPYNFILSREKVKLALKRMVQSTDVFEDEVESQVDNATFIGCESDDEEHVTEASPVASPVSQKVPLFCTWSQEETIDFLKEEIFSVIQTVYFNEYDIHVQRNPRFEEYFGVSDNASNALTTVERFHECKMSFHNIFAQLEVGRAGGFVRQSMFAVKPFSGLNNMRREARLKTTRKDEPFRDIGEFFCIHRD